MTGESFVKYIHPGKLDQDWGLYLNVAGYATILPGESYPPSGHPAGYSFKWENGRILDEFQLNYITKGEGILETRQAKYNVKEGSVIVLFPGMWHRYQPLSEGWKEYYVGFNGDYAQRIFDNEFFRERIPVLNVGYSEVLLRHFQEIIEYVRSEKTGYQQICSGIVIYLISSIISIKKNESFEGREIGKVIQKACVVMRENLAKTMNMKDLAGELGIGYTYFRVMFKSYTGLSPAQYHLSLRLRQAKDLLASTDLSIKEIAYRLGFNSIYYFSRIFRSKTGKTPTEFKSGLSEQLLS